MRQQHPARSPAASAREGRFVLYLEGAGDRGILEGWCRRALPALAARISRSAVILGGRRPARAASHFRELGGEAAGLSGLCVLDGDDGRGHPAPPEEPGLAYFTWERRHIESYLLVPAAIRRGMGLAESDGRVARVLRAHLPAEGDPAGWRSLDAKRFLGPGGPLARTLGAPVPLTRVARATRESELHPDVKDCLSHLRRAFGGIETAVVR